MKIKKAILNYLNNYDQHPVVTVFIFGLYPFFHYFNGNISEATSWQQLVFLLVLCFVLPQMLLVLMPYVLKLPVLIRFRSHGLEILCFVVLFGLIAFFLFYPHKKKILVLIVIGFGLGWLLSKHLTKVIVIQFILIPMSLVTLIPKLIFHIKQDNASWAEISQEELQTTFNYTPNIFVIQPDGYVNFSEIDKSPYDFDNSDFEHFLINEGFTNYENFRSNYYSTYTSNSSMFAMKHHYYSNTYKSTLKTHKANEVIVGKYNNVLKILKQNDYASYLITDNSFFLIDREPLEFDYSNIDSKFISYHNSGAVYGADVIKDLSQAIDTITSQQNFFFIEKTLPSHIIYRKSDSKGKEAERLRYLKRLTEANEWITSILKIIDNYDNNALVIIVADHGGQVGMDYTLQILQRKLNPVEALSTFSSLLSIKWPDNLKSNNLTFSSNVNLFRKVLYALSGNNALLAEEKENSSFLPFKNKSKVGYYRYINGSGEFVFERLSN